MHLTEIAAGLLDLDNLLSDTIGIHSGSVTKAPKDQRRLRFVHLNNALLDVMMYRGFLRYHKTRAHIDTLCAQRQCSSKTAAVCETT